MLASQFGISIGAAASRSSLAVIATFAFIGCAHAASCVPLGTPSIDLTSFQSAPASLLMSDKATPDAIEKQVGQIVSQETETRQAVLGLVTRASGDEKKAIGKGLAQSLVNCQHYNALEAFKLQEDVVKLGDPDVLQAFMTGANSFRAFAVSGGFAPSTGSGDEGGGPHKNDSDSVVSAFSSGTFSFDGMTLFTPRDTTTNAFASKSP